MKKILIIQTAFPGDAILTLPMIQRLSELFPASEIDVVAIPSTAEIFKSSPHVRKVFVYDKRGENKSILSLFKFAARLRKNNYDLLYSPHRSFRTSMLVYLSGIKNSTGFNISSFSRVYRTRIKYERSLHEVQRNLTLIGDSNPDWKIKPEMVLPNVEHLLPKGYRSKLLALAPGSVWETKKYPLDYFRELVKKMTDKNYFILLLGSREDFKICEELNITPGKNTWNFAGELSIVESTSILSNCDLLISNDSAPTHMGMAADISVLTLYCSTIPEFGFYPYNSKSFSLSYNNLKCKPCGIHGYKKCPEGTFECAYQLKPEIVFNKIMEILNS